MCKICNENDWISVPAKGLELPSGAVAIWAAAPVLALAEFVGTAVPAEGREADLKKFHNVTVMARTYQNRSNCSICQLVLRMFWGCLGTDLGFLGTVLGSLGVLLGLSQALLGLSRGLPPKYLIIRYIGGGPPPLYT
jgi:hypothetical protein